MKTMTSKRQRQEIGKLFDPALVLISDLHVALDEIQLVLQIETVEDDALWVNGNQVPSF